MTYARLLATYKPSLIWVGRGRRGELIGSEPLYSEMFCPLWSQDMDDLDGCDALLSPPKAAFSAYAQARASARLASKRYAAGPVYQIEDGAESLRVLAVLRGPRGAIRGHIELLFAVRSAQASNRGGAVRLDVHVESWSTLSRGILGDMGTEPGLTYVALALATDLHERLHATMPEAWALSSSLWGVRNKRTGRPSPAGALLEPLSGYVYGIITPPGGRPWRNVVVRELEDCLN